MKRWKATGWHWANTSWFLLRVYLESLSAPPHRRLTVRGWVFIVLVNILRLFLMKSVSKKTRSKLLSEKRKITACDYVVSGSRWPHWLFVLRCNLHGELQLAQSLKPPWGFLISLQQERVLSKYNLHSVCQSDLYSMFQKAGVYMWICPVVTISCESYDCMPNVTMNF